MYRWSRGARPATADHKIRQRYFENLVSARTHKRWR